MRTSNKRSRSKNNRNRPSGGNIVNRVFDSSGPEGKVRGTPQQIIDKYNQLTRDAQLSGDRVAAENFAQHAEHYTRMLAEAQREMDQKREQHEQQNQNRQPNSDQPRQQNDGGDARRPDDGRGQDDGDRSRDEARPAEPAAQEEAPAEPVRKPRNRRKPAPKDEPQKTEGPRDDVIDTGSDESGSGLVETPENAPKPRRTRKRKTADDTPQEGNGGGENQAAE
ncbi:DUF4167 domain-containing protein [Palleronia sp. LCG004]|uniref:DUF4167 domain-containing protein n=1 Tax=Palleronia sp. LCG004 TaxID=3079304 RepID=UPI002941E3F9|nr:DUF4167 domain-containing protein [Palleronia sp. LCG004]WOI55209.1 DUF4167 domain-containing protein [Palleronia sp. LCG004]